MLEIRPIQPGDMEFVRSDPFEKQVKCYPEFVPPSDSVTVIFDNEIVAVGGIGTKEDGLPYGDGVGEVWLMLTNHSRKHGIFGMIALNAIEKEMTRLIKSRNLHTGIATARADFPESIKMIEAFGFERKGIKKNYTPDGCDLIVYSKQYEVSELC